MILKGSQRGNPADLAVHLMNSFENESVEITEVSGTVARDLLGAFAEMDAVASGTRATKALYSLSINPPSPLTRAQYYEAIQTIERRLGLTSQPRAVVFHVKRDKHGIPREHCHVVWSRINADKMKAIHMAHDRRRLMDLACELAHKYGLDLPPGLQAWEKQERFDRQELDPTLAEKAQAEETGISPEQRRAEITACYEQSDNGEAFRIALEYEGYVLARGDRRGFVIVDEFGNPHSLTRYVKGHKAKDIRAKLAPLIPEDLPTVAQAKEYQRQRRTAREEKEGEGERQHRLEQQRQKEHEALAAKHAAHRVEIDIKQQELLTRQQHETLSLHAAQLTESQGLVFRLRSAVANLIGRTPGLRSVLGPIQKLTHLDPKERHGLEREALARRHRRERQEIARLKRAQARIEARERAALDKKIRKAARLARELEQAVQQDFHGAARDPFMRAQTGIGEGDLSVKFNDTGEFVEGPPDGFHDDDHHGPPDRQRHEEDIRRSHHRDARRRRRKGHGYQKKD